MRLWEPKRKCPTSIPTHLRNHAMWSRTLKRSVKSCVTGPSTRCYFNKLPFMRVLTHGKIEEINVCERSECHGLLGFVWGLCPRGGFWKSSRWLWNMIRSMPWRNPHGLHIHLASTYSVGPSRVVWSELGLAPLFLPMKVLAMQWSQAHNLVCEVARSKHSWTLSGDTNSEITIFVNWRLFHGLETNQGLQV